MIDSTDVPSDSSAYVPNVNWIGPVQAYDVMVVISGSKNYARKEITERVLTENPALIHRAIEQFAISNHAVVLEKHFIQSTVKPFEL